MVIAKRNRGLNSSFIVRKISSGEGVERTFQTYSPLIASIEVKRKGDVRRAKLYYLRERSGKSARIRERMGGEEAVAEGAAVGRRRGADESLARHGRRKGQVTENASPLLGMAVLLLAGNYWGTGFRVL